MGLCCSSDDNQIQVLHYHSHEDGGKVKSVEIFCNNRKHLVQKYFATNGRLTLEETYICGLLDGYKRTWDEKGNLLSYTEYKNNCKHGVDRVYSLALLTNSTSGLKVNNILIRETTYYYDSKQGRHREWKVKDNITDCTVDEYYHRGTISEMKLDGMQLQESPAGGITLHTDNDIRDRLL